MWWTSHGERVLRGAEWELFREGLDTLWDWVESSFEDPEICDTGVEAFDRLQVGQKVALLALVGTALSDERTSKPDLTVNTEATVAAIFSRIATEVLLEIDRARDPKGLATPHSPEKLTLWRRLVLAAYREALVEEEAKAAAYAKASGRTKPDDLLDGEDDPDGPWPPPEVTSEDADDWEFIVECLSNRILWCDGDHLAGDKYLDIDPAEARARMEMLGIAVNYYTDIAPDPTDEQLEPIRRTLRSLCGRPEPEESEESELIPGLEDLHHGLFVGPCDAETVAEEVACPLVAEIGDIGEDDFDCSYAEWAQLFRAEVRRAASAGPPESTALEIVLSPRQMADAERAGASGGPLVLDDDHRAELREGVWIVVNRFGHVLVGIDESLWDIRDNVTGLPPLKFSTPEEALIGYLRSMKMATARSERNEAALRRLGRE
jgi:hypothetical protein